jgi:hypothetical protein
MSEKNLAEMTMAEYAARSEPLYIHERWLPKGARDENDRYQHVQVLYLNARTRFKIAAEKHSYCAFAMDRREAAHAADVDIDDLDTREFAKDLMKIIGGDLSIHTLGIFIEELQIEHAKWEQERLAAMGANEHTK